MKQTIILNEILQEYQKLSPEYQQALHWLIYHGDSIEAMVTDDDISEQKLKDDIEYGRIHKEYILHVLLSCKKNRKEEEVKDAVLEES